LAGFQVIIIGRFWVIPEVALYVKSQQAKLVMPEDRSYAVFVFAAAIVVAVVALLVIAYVAVNWRRVESLWNPGIWGASATLLIFAVSMWSLGMQIFVGLLPLLSLPFRLWPVVVIFLLWRILQELQHISRKE
jgi:hypothetical protein